LDKVSKVTGEPTEWREERYFYSLFPDPGFAGKELEGPTKSKGHPFLPKEAVLLLHEAEGITDARMKNLALISEGGRVAYYS
jgi:hypothetical protein